jgi:ribonuclease HI
MAELIAYVDGGCLGNPGPSGIGVVINGCADGPVRIAKWIGRQDNNVAEYAALMEALQYAVARKARTLHVYSDSEVVVRQMTGEYVCRSPRLYSLHWTCRKLARSLKFSISHVPREDNAEANGLAQSALRRAPGVPQNLLQSCDHVGV